VPSYFRDPRLACPATQYYKCVMIRGRARVVTDADEKARALQTMMEKLQPEGGHEPISADSPLYRKSLKTTAVVAIEVERMTGKFKFGQNLPKSKRDGVAERLEARGCPVDRATAAAIRKYND
jgi:predicted FMN-binding regulatory protein PaiB